LTALQGPLHRRPLLCRDTHEDRSELEDLFMFGPTPRPGIAGKDNKVSVACYTRVNQVVSALQPAQDGPA
jgi:hypothetical protein